MKKTITTSALVLTMAAITSVLSPYTLAHVTVKPAQVGVAVYQTFTAGVPNEKDIPTTGLRVVIPEGMTSIMPVVKPGWTISTKTVKVGETEKVSEIIWSGGSIPVGQRDEFSFSAKSPASEATVQWKAYQTYSNGVIVAWDQSPEELKKTEEAKASSSGEHKEEEHATGPYSETKIINDLTGPTSTVAPPQTSSSDNVSQLMAGIALIASFSALALGLKKK
ncbi:MAG: YcnI family protein [Candidatus Pacebacteria bacterium]|nr:YcnI family protein [Candidatus Paceibacterota bacterium]